MLRAVARVRVGNGGREEGREAMPPEIGDVSGGGGVEGESCRALAAVDFEIFVDVIYFFCI